MTDDIADLVITAQNAAREGKQPHEILRLLATHVAPKWPGHIPIITIERSLMCAFDIPLRDVRNMEAWNGWSGRGYATDQDIDTLLGPWITRYLEQSK